ncbi:SpvB/TcaC N-terminal domain-containing protein [Nonomuraea typhae]|uniref:SpvB/TcaC N-terminal domain-containing protein n=1 Tax=Nonomuraea typhae TaxID=2603600 RepID=A0ABW7ZAN5_9ACTN
MARRQDASPSAHGGPSAGGGRAPGPLTPMLSMPKGGGAIRGLGERFGANAPLGTAAMTIPLPLSPSRSDFQPDLALSYDSSSGNGPFGLGWQLPLPHVTRRIDRGVPRYDAGDTFRLARDDLVEAGRSTAPGHTVTRFVRRVEGAFARVERWTRLTDGDVHWRTLTGENILSVFGRTPAERISDPADPGRVFTWLLSETRDPYGNAVVYEYQPEDTAGVDLTQPHELARGARTAARYLKRVRYGNRVPLLDASGRRPAELSRDLRASADWMFELVLDYGDHAGTDPLPDRPRPARRDPFSSYRQGFELRQYRLCRRALMFHHFPLEPGMGAGTLVAALELEYGEGPLAQLASVTRHGYRRDPAGGYERASLPPVRLEYTPATIGHTVAEAKLENVPAGPYQWIDLYGEGMPGILTEHQGTWYYKHNLGGGRFGPHQAVATRPSPGRLGGGRQVLLDLSGDGRLDVVALAGSLTGFAGGTDGKGWREHAPFRELPQLDLTRDDVRLADLSGDGLADLLVTGDDALTWYPSLGERGFGPGLRVSLPDREERGPKLVRADEEQAVFLADMSGDGLYDLVRVRNAEICYWPSLGHGRFGERIVTSRSPLLEEKGRFSARNVRLADVDGTGTADVIYLGGTARLWFNESGNSWSAPIELPSFPHLDDLSAVTVTDLLGSGTACLVWSTPAAVDAPSPLRYVDLMAGGPPRLLSRVTNSMGAETVIRYAPSTRFYTADQRAGRPWLTRLPFPLHVVEQVESIDHVDGTRLVSRYAYRHGYFDPGEREFRGFALIERTDSESFADYVRGTQRAGGHQELAPELFQPPVTTRSWFHTGAFEDLDELHREFYRQRRELPPTAFPPGLSTGDYRACVAALKGLPLRQEVYSHDGTPAQAHPYAITEHRYAVRRVQDGAVLPVGVETLTLHGERDPGDERAEHALVLESDAFGRPLTSAAVVYGRAGRDPELPQQVAGDQARTYVTCTRTDRTPAIGTVSDHRLPAPAESRTYQLTGVAKAGGRYSLVELRAGFTAAADVDYAVTPAEDAPRRRLLERSRTLYRGDDLAPLPLGRQSALGLTFESYRLAFTGPVIDAHYAGVVTAADWAAAGYRDLDGDGDRWIPSGTSRYPADPAAAFYLPDGARDPFGVETRIAYDRYHLLAESVSVTQAAWQRTSVVNDYRVLGPVELTDPNRNRTAVAYDPLGLPVRRAVMGKAGSADGDTLDDPTEVLEYDLTRWASGGRPNVTRRRAREQHGQPGTAWHESYVYASGSGGVALVKTQAPGGWLATGRTIVNNKGNPVKQYEPYFSPTPEYDDFEVLATVGVTPVIRYDPLGRAVRTDLPDGTFTTVTVGAWRLEVHDANDTVLASDWYAERGSPDPAGPEPADPDRRAAWLAARHARTPAAAHLDPLGRTILTVSRHEDGRTASIRSELDLTGRHAAVFDQLGRRTSSGFTSMTGLPVFGTTAERGGRWTFADAGGGLVRSWDEHGRVFRAAYDALRRPTGLAVRDGTGPQVLLHHVVYGDRHPDALARNLNGAAHQTFDQAGVITVESADFKGVPHAISRRLTADPAVPADWQPVADAAGYPAAQAAAATLLDPAPPFTSSAVYDALNRPREITLPDGTVLAPAYDRAGRLAALGARLGGQGPVRVFLAGQTYDAKGRRLTAEHGNGVRLRYGYDPASLRLTELAAGDLQRLRYTYDPVGNVTAIRDDAQQTRFFANAVVTPETRYTYDALYQLLTATGRELAAGNDAIRDAGDLAGIVPLPHVNDTAAVRPYTEHYAYDAAGNLTSLRHVAAVNGGTWTRHYRYRYQDDPADRTNRLAATSRPGDPEAGPYTETYAYDRYGNVAGLSQHDFLWNALDQLQEIDLGTGGTARYAYGADGGRVRAVVRRPNGLVRERVYLGALEIYRERQGTAAPHLVRNTLHISDDSGQIAQVSIKTVDSGGSDPDNPLGAPVIRYQYGNHLGSAVLETDDQGGVTGYEEYHPYGTTAYRSAKSAAGLSLKRYRFGRRERDEESGLYYCGARYYAAWLGRWISPDPAGFADGLNQYRYCRNNPVMYGDPDGRQPSPLGQVSWEVPSSVYMEAGRRVPDAVAITRFEAWLARAHPDRAYRPGTVTIDWNSMRGRRGPTFNAEWTPGGAALPSRGDFGHVEPMQRQPKAEYTDPADRATRTTENEHTTPHAQSEAVEPGYDQRAYRRDPTVRSPRGVSLDKTRGDNARSTVIQNRAATGRPIDITQDIDMAGNAEFHRANEAARTAGRPHIANPGSINRGTLAQMGQRFQRGQGTSPPAGAVIEEPDIRPWTPPSGSGGGSGGGGARTGGGGAGRVAGSLASTLVPGFAEAELAGIYAHSFTAGTLGVTGPAAEVAAAISAAPTTFAFAVTLPALGGGIAGNVAESAAAGLGASRNVSIGAAVLAAAGTGAIIGTFIPIPGVGTAAGAAIGAAIGVIGYGLSKLF